jgi:hypothetical protein
MGKSVRKTDNDADSGHKFGRLMTSPQGTSGEGLLPDMTTIDFHFQKPIMGA